MAEYIRSIRVRIDVDTNKDTYMLDAPRGSFDEVCALVDEFLTMVEAGL